MRLHFDLKENPMLSAALTRLPLYGLLAFAPLTTSPQTAAPWPAAQVNAAGDQTEDATRLPAMTGNAPPMRSVRKLSDSALTCAQIQAETQTLEKAGQAQQAEAAQAQEAMADTQSEMMKNTNALRGGGVGSAIGSRLLGMIPGAGEIQSYAMQAAAEARRAYVQEGVNKMMQNQTRLMHLEQALEHTQARSEHLVDLFLKKGCTLSQRAP